MDSDSQTAYPDRELTLEEARARVDKLRSVIKVEEGRPIKVVGIGAGAWGAVFSAMLTQMYGSYPDLVRVSIWRRAGKSVPKATIEGMLSIINSHEDVLRRLRNDSVYLKYVGGRLGDRELMADEILRDGLCLNLPEVPLCPLKVVTSLEEAVYDADVIINGLPSTQTRAVFETIGGIFRASRSADNFPIVISLSKGVETRMTPYPHVVTPTRIVHEVAGVPMDKVFYLGGPNIAAEVWKGEYANARICGTSKPLRKALAAFLSNDNFVCWNNADVITHEVLGGLKNVYSIGMGIITAVTNDSATSKAVYFSNAAAEMVFVTRLLSKHPEDLHGPLLADTFVTFLKGRNAWYGKQLGLGRIHVRDGDVIPGKGLIQGISAVHAFCELLSDPSILILDHVSKKEVTPINVLPIMRMLKEVLTWEGDMTEAAAFFHHKLKAASSTDPTRRLKSTTLFRSSLTRLPGDDNDEEEDSVTLSAGADVARARGEAERKSSVV